MQEQPLSKILYKNIHKFKKTIQNFLIHIIHYSNTDCETTPMVLNLDIHLNLINCNHASSIRNTPQLTTSSSANILQLSFSILS